MDTQIANLETVEGPIDCACVIHGNTYSWTYVERLYNMLTRHLSRGIQLHVYTEADRSVPEPMIKHVLPEWQIHGPRQSWWYKMCLFNSTEHTGPLLYFDLDTVIVDNIDWICELPLTWFWTVRDFQYLWRPLQYTINSSVMWWDTQKFSYVWQDFQNQNLQQIMKKYRGDQDYLKKIIENQHLRFLDSERIKSWRWQCLDNGYNFKNRYSPGMIAKTVLTNNTDILIFHGQPKPSDLNDPVVNQHWK